MKRAAVLAILSIMFIILSGCKTEFLPKREEIDNLLLVQVVGIDKNPDTGECMITLATKNLQAVSSPDSSGSTGGSGSKKKALILTATGKTIFDAVRNVQLHTDKTIFWGHASFYLFGENVARENLTTHLDFLTRDHELRIESKIFIVRDLTAKDLMERSNQSEYYIFDKLESISRNLKYLGNSEEMKIHELIRFIDIHHASARVPCIHLTTRDRENGEPVFDIESYGYAIISNNRLVGFLDPDIARGVNIITGNLKSSIVPVKDPEGNHVSLEIVGCDTKIIPVFSGDNLESITIKAKVTSHVGEVQSQDVFSSKTAISYMEARQSEILKNEVEEVLEKVRQFRSDCLEICDRIRLKSPLKWRKIEDRWMQVFFSVRIDVQVESKILRTYEMRDPTGSRGRKSQ